MQLNAITLLILLIWYRWQYLYLILSPSKIKHEKLCEKLLTDIDKSIQHIGRSRRTVWEKIEKYKFRRDSRVEKIIDGERSGKFSKKERNIENHDPVECSLKNDTSQLDIYIYISIIVNFTSPIECVSRKKYGIVACEEIAFGLCNFLEHAVFARRRLTLSQSNTSCKVIQLKMYISPRYYFAKNL